MKTILYLIFGAVLIGTIYVLTNGDLGAMTVWFLFYGSLALGLNQERPRR
jgi:hypothetical protein